MMRLVSAPLAFVLFLTFTASAQQPNRPGSFDFYVLALAWSPSYCEAEGDRRRDDQCAHGRPYAFVVHGLWPQFDRGFPRDCINPAPRIPEALIQSMLGLMPARGLVIHQWRTHGTCSGLEAADYFEVVREARERVTIPERFHRLEQPLSISPDEVEEAFLAANNELEPNMLAVTCDQHRLREVRICLTRDYVFRACPEIDRRACRASKVVMPPVRRR